MILVFLIVDLFKDEMDPGVTTCSSSKFSIRVVPVISMVKPYFVWIDELVRLVVVNDAGKLRPYVSSTLAMANSFIPFSINRPIVRFFLNITFLMTVTLSLPLT